MTLSFHSRHSSTRYSGRRAWVCGLAAVFVVMLSALVGLNWGLVAPSGALAGEIVREMFVQYWPAVVGIVAVAAVAGWLVGRGDTAD